MRQGSVDRVAAPMSLPPVPRARTSITSCPTNERLGLRRALSTRRLSVPDRRRPASWCVGVPATIRNGSRPRPRQTTRTRDRGAEAPDEVPAAARRRLSCRSRYVDQHGRPPGPFAPAPGDDEAVDAGKAPAGPVAHPVAPLAQAAQAAVKGGLDHADPGRVEALAAERYPRGPARGGLAGRADRNAGPGEREEAVAGRGVARAAGAGRDQKRRAGGCRRGHGPDAAHGYPHVSTLSSRRAWPA